MNFTNSVLNDLADRRAEIQLDGGKLVVEWAQDNHLYMTGPALEVYTGTYEIKD